MVAGIIGIPVYTFIALFYIGVGVLQSFLASIIVFCVLSSIYLLIMMIRLKKKMEIFDKKLLEQSDKYGGSEGDSRHK